MTPEELDTGPPSKMRSPSWRLGRRGVSIERATIGTYPASAELSSALSRLVLLRSQRGGVLPGVAGKSAYLTAKGGHMPLVAVTIKLDQIDEGLLYQGRRRLLLAVLRLRFRDRRQGPDHRRAIDSQGTLRRWRERAASGLLARDRRQGQAAGTGGQRLRPGEIQGHCHGSQAGAGDGKYPPGRGGSLSRWRSNQNRVHARPMTLHMKTNTDPQPETFDWSAMEVSMVDSAKATKTKSVTVGGMLDAIRSGKWAKEVEAITALYNKALETAQREGKTDPVAVAKEAVRKDKEKLPGILFSGRFSRRADEALEQHSGITLRRHGQLRCSGGTPAKLATDKHVLFAFPSPTGSGVKVGVRVKADASLHGASFAASRKHFGEAYGVTIDEQCKNVSRLCFASYAPDIFIRQEDAEVLEPLPRAARAAAATKTRAGSRNLRIAAAALLPGLSGTMGTRRREIPSGTWLHDRTVTKDGEIMERDYRLCAPLEVLGKSSTRDLEHGRLVEFVSSNHITKRHIVPMRLLAGRGDEALGELMSGVRDRPPAPPRHPGIYSGIHPSGALDRGA